MLSEGSRQPQLARAAIAADNDFPGTVPWVGNQSSARCHAKEDRRIQTVKDFALRRNLDSRTAIEDTVAELVLQAGSGWKG